MNHVRSHRLLQRRTWGDHTAWRDTALVERLASMVGGIVAEKFGTAVVHLLAGAYFVPRSRALWWRLPVK